MKQFLVFPHVPELNSAALDCVSLLEDLMAVW